MSLVGIVRLSEKLGTGSFSYFANVLGKRMWGEGEGRNMAQREEQEVKRRGKNWHPSTGGATP